MAKNACCVFWISPIFSASLDKLGLDPDTFLRSGRRWTPRTA